MQSFTYSKEEIQRRLEIVKESVLLLTPIGRFESFSQNSSCFAGISYGVLREGVRLVSARVSKI